MDRFLFRFVTMHAFDRHTDGRTIPYSAVKHRKYKNTNNAETTVNYRTTITLTTKLQ